MPMAVARRYRTAAARFSFACRRPPASALETSSIIIGEVGTYYGAPQLAASDAPLPVAGAKQIAPNAVKSAPIASKLEWRLVTVTGGVTALTKDGDNWHAEVAVTGGSIPIDGISRSAIPSSCACRRPHRDGRRHREARLPDGQ